MTDTAVLMSAATVLAVVALLAFSTLKAFRGWLELKRAELDRHTPAAASGAAGRIEVADLKERVRKLEAIAAGVDL